MSIRSGFQKITILLGSLLLSLCVLEIAVRLFAPIPYAGATAWFVSHPYMVYLGNPLHSGINLSGFGDVEHELEAAPDTVRIAVIGGSTSFGVDNWPSRLELVLNRQSPSRRKVEVLNFGMAGFTTAESLINVAVNIQDYTPDILIIHHALNDLMPRLFRNPSRDYSHFRRLLTYDPGPIVGRSQLLLFVREKLYGVPSLANTTMTVNEASDANPYDPSRLAGDGSIFERNLRTIIAIADAAGITTVLTTMPYSLDSSKLPRQWSIDHETKVDGMKQHNQVIRELAVELEIALVDLDVEMTGVEEFFRDHIHGSELGKTTKAERIATSSLIAGLIETAAQQQRSGSE